MRRRSAMGGLVGLGALAAGLAGRGAAAAGDAPALKPPVKGRIPVAVLIGPGATVIDFAGPWEVFQDVMVDGLFGAIAYKVYGQKMVDESYDQVGSPITVGLKDANLIAEAADLARVPLPSHDVYRQRLLGAVAHGDADRDQAVLALEQARACGLD